MSGYQRKVLSIEPDDLLAYWPLDESTGDTAADASGYAHDGAADNDLIWGESGIGDGGTGAGCDGLRTYIDVYSASLGALLDGDEGTLLLWVKSSNGFNSGSGSPRVFARLADSLSNQVLIYSDDTGNVVGQRTANGTSFWPSSASLSGNNDWNCLVLTWSKSADELKLYVNGSLADTDTGLTAWNGSGLSSADTLLGAYNVSSGIVSLPWDGDIAHVAVWSKALSATQVGDLAKLYLMPTTMLSEGAVGLPLVRGADATTWTVAVDWDRDGSFGGQYDDVTDLVVSANWFLGMREPFQESADNSMLTLVLRNDDRRFSPENTGSPLYGSVAPFKRVRITSSDGVQTYTHWLGWISRIEPSVNANGKREVTISAAGPMQFFKAAETAIALQENQPTDQIVQKLIQEVVIPPAMSAAWVLGRAGNSELGVTTILADTTSFSDLEVGSTKLAFAGDNWVQRGGRTNQAEDTFNVYRAITDVAAAERGRFWFDREGKAIFWNRHHLLQGVPDATAFDDTMTDLVYQYGGPDFKNEVVVMCHPRVVSDSDQEVLWQLDDKVRVAKGKTEEIQAKFQDESDNRIGGKDVTLSDVEFRFGSEQTSAQVDGNGRSASATSGGGGGAASVTLDARANSAVLTVTNQGQVKAVLLSCTIRGKKITDFGVMETKEADAASIVDYGRRTLKLNLPAVDNFDDAQGIALFELHRRSHPRGAVESVTLQDGGDGGQPHQYQRVLSLGDVVTIEETQTQHANSYCIIGEAHRLTAGATLLETTWYLEAMPDSYPWKLGDPERSVLGVSTAITY